MNARLPALAGILFLLTHSATAVAGRSARLVLSQASYMQQNVADNVSWRLSCIVENLGGLPQTVTIRGRKVKTTSTNAVNSNTEEIAPTSAFTLQPGETYEKLITAPSTLTTTDFLNMYPRSLTFEVAEDRGAVIAYCALTYNMNSFNYALPFQVNGSRPF